MLSKRLGWMIGLSLAVAGCEAGPNEPVESTGTSSEALDIPFFCPDCYANLDECQHSNELLNNQIASVQQTLATYVAQTSSLNSALSGCRSQVTSLTNERDSLNASLGTCQTNLTSCATTRDQLSSELAATRSSLSSTEAALASAQAELAAAKADLAATKAQLASTANALAASQAALSGCSSDLDTCEAAAADNDNDGEIDRTDSCLGTASGAEVDAAGCSLAQFCARTVLSGPPDKGSCTGADFQNDEPDPHHPGDCRVEGKGQALLCVAAQ
jgi:predicted  nucleic acid-binding Zn-ribbon protein